MTDTILVVDDDPMILKYLEGELKRRFFNPIFASTGAEALTRLAGVDIVISDIKLPDMDGLELVSHINDRNAVAPRIETIVITGYGSQEIAVSALRLGAIDYIEKPINFDDLNAALGRAHEIMAKRRNLTLVDTVLVIDDEKEVAEKLRREMEKEGYKAFCCFGGKDALELIAKTKIDVVITDVQMKDMSGIEVLQEAKKLYTDIEVIMMTGFGGQEVAIKSLRAGAIDYLTKPVDLDQLIWAVKKAIEKMRLFRSSLYRSRELKLSAEIVAKLNEEQEKIIKERTTQLTQTQANLIQTSKLATLGEMSAGMAHELNQPLFGISLVSQTLRKLKTTNTLTDEEFDLSLKDLDQCVVRMSKIIQHVRTFARQESLKFMSVDVNSTLDSALILTGAQLKMHGIQITKNFDPSLPKIHGEPYQLEQVWINLIGNSRDAIDEMDVKAKEKQIKCNKALTITTKVEGDQIFVVVEDTGIGMSEEQQKKVFQPFFTTKPVGKGMGLGMAIVYGIIELHKAKIELVSEQEKGTTITVKLPLPKNMEGQE